MVNAIKIAESQCENIDLSLALFFIMEWALNNMMIPGRIENWMVMLDLKDVKITSLNLPKMKTFANAIMSNYRGRLFRLVICNSSWIVRGWWAMLQTIFDGFTAKKIIMTGDSDSKEF